MTSRHLVIAATLLGVLGRVELASAQPPTRTVSVTIPAGVSFLVTDVGASTTGSPSPTQISFNDVIGFRRNDNFTVSVRADSSTFSGPGTTRIAASSVSWTATTSSGLASNGTLSSTAYSQVYQSVRDPGSGSVDITWTLGAIAAAGLRSGTHTLTVRWRLEAL